MGDRSSTRTYHSAASHHSKSSWSLGWTEPEAAQPRVSANAYATGSNQNAGNVLTGRPTSRVLAPPGGGHSDIFHHGPDPDQAAKATSRASAAAPERKVSSNAYASGSNQNAGNVLTDRPTTRVHAPPGGSSSNIFGTDPVQEPKASWVAPPQQQPVEPTPIVDKTNVVHTAPAPGTKKVEPPVDSRVSSNAYATGSNQNCGNFITERPTTRVHAPPGGVSNITFG